MSKKQTGPIALLTIFGIASGLPATAAADSNVYIAEAQGRIEVYWTAVGCGGVKGVCGGGWIDHVCQKKTLRTGESDGYHFKDLTTLRNVSVFFCEANADGGDSTGNKGNKKRCAVTAGLNFKCGYTAVEYEKLKNGDDPGTATQ
jgi:hypothetical protein